MLHIHFYLITNFIHTEISSSDESSAAGKPLAQNHKRLSPTLQVFLQYLDKTHVEYEAVVPDEYDINEVDI